MKKIIIFIPVIFMFLQPVNAQKDTTEIKIGKKKFIIIDDNFKNDRDIRDLESSIIVFEKEKERAEKELVILKKENSELKDSLNNQKITEVQKENISEKLKFSEKKILDKKKKILSFENGIIELKNDIAEIKNRMSENDTVSRPKTETWSRNNKFLKKNNYGKFNAHWSGFRIGLNNFMNQDYNFDLPANTEYMKLNPEKSWNFSLNVKEFNFPIIKKNIGFFTGVGLEWSSFSFYENITLYEDENNIINAHYIEKDVKTFTKNKLNTGYLTVPMAFEYQTSGENKFYISVGAVGSLRLYTKQKQKYILNSSKIKNKTLDNFQVNPFKYELFAQVGYKGVSLFVNRSFSTFFRKNQGPELYPITIGLSFTGN